MGNVSPTFPMPVDQLGELQTQYIYTHHEKGGVYVIEGACKAAGALRSTVDNGLIVYRDVHSDQLYVRQRVDFSKSMIATGFVCTGENIPLYINHMPRKASIAAINWLMWYYEDHVALSRFLKGLGSPAKDENGERFSLLYRIQKLIEK